MSNTDLSKIIINFCKKKRLKYVEEDDRVIIQNKDGIYNIHIYYKQEPEEKEFMVGYVLGEGFGYNESSRYEWRLNSTRMLHKHLVKIYPRWLAANRTWQNISKYN